MRLEFKRGDVVDNPVTIARAAAAMLNTDGGVIWIGIEEVDGIATRAQRIADVAAVRRRVHDSLVDRIEPAPTDGEVSVEEIEGLLAVQVQKGRRGPYAFLERSMRGFVERIDARIRPLDREELRSRFQAKPRSTRAEVAEQALAVRRGPPRQTSDGAGAGLFVWFHPTSELEVDLRSDRLGALLKVPEASGNRRMGWNFTSEFHHLEPAKAGKTLWRADHRSHYLELKKGGELLFAVPLSRLHWKGEPQEIYPWALIEYVLSVCRLYPALVKAASTLEPTRVLVALSLRGIEKWILRPHSPRSAGYEISAPGTPEGDIELKPIAFEWSDLDQAPDACGWRLLELVYDHFGFGENQMPAEYDRKNRQFQLAN